MDLAVGLVCLVLGAICVVAGVVVAWSNRKAQPPKAPDASVGDQGSVTDAIKNTTEFAKALKDLDLSGKLLTVGVLLIAIAAIVAGLDSIADAIEATAQ